METQQRLTGLNYPLKLSSSEFLALADAGLFERFTRTELIEGEVWTVNSVYRWHSRAQIEFAIAIKEGLTSADLEFVVYGAGSVLMSDDSVPEPDISVALDEPKIRAPISIEAVRIAVELADASREMDLKRKPPIYARCGIAEYWVADRKKQVLVQHSAPGPSGYASVVDIKFGQPVHSASLAGLVVDTASLIG